jgi:rRNA biogenesis protein RRP5
MLEYKHARPESGRTMFEGIVTNYPKRMDIWSIYMDMEVKYGGKESPIQARHLFERCLSLAEIQKKPKKMKLVFRKYMEFESANGNKQKLAALRQRVEEYLEKAFKKTDESGSGSGEEKSGSDSQSDQE